MTSDETTQLTWFPSKGLKPSIPRSPFHDIDWSGSRANYRQYLCALHPALEALLYHKVNPSPSTIGTTFPMEIWTCIACFGRLGDKASDLSRLHPVIALSDLVFAGSAAGRRRHDKLEGWQLERLARVRALAHTALLMAKLCRLNRTFFLWHLAEAPSFLRLFLRDLGCLNRHLSTDVDGMLKTHCNIPKTPYAPLEAVRKGQAALAEYDAVHGTVEGIPTLSVVLPFGTFDGTPHRRIMSSAYDIYGLTGYNRDEKGYVDSAIPMGPIKAILRTTANMHLYGGLGHLGYMHLLPTNAVESSIGGDLMRRLQICYRKSFHRVDCIHYAADQSYNDFSVRIPSREDLARNAATAGHASAIFWQASEADRKKVLEDCLLPAEQASVQMLQSHAHLVLRLLMELTGTYSFCVLCDVSLRQHPYESSLTVGPYNFQMVCDQRVLFPPPGISWGFADEASWQQEQRTKKEKKARQATTTTTTTTTPSKMSKKAAVKRPAKRNVAVPEPTLQPCCPAHLPDVWNHGRKLADRPLVPFPRNQNHSADVSMTPCVRGFNILAGSTVTEAPVSSCVCGWHKEHTAEPRPWYRDLYVPLWVIQRERDYDTVACVASLYGRAAANELLLKKAIEKAHDEYNIARENIEELLKRDYALSLPTEAASKMILDGPLRYAQQMGTKALRAHVQGFPGDEHTPQGTRRRLLGIATTGNVVTKILKIAFEDGGVTSDISKIQNADKKLKPRESASKKKKTKKRKSDDEPAAPDPKRAKIIELYQIGAGDDAVGVAAPKVGIDLEWPLPLLDLCAPITKPETLEQVSQFQEDV